MTTDSVVPQIQAHLVVLSGCRHVLSGDYTTACNTSPRHISSCVDHGSSLDLNGCQGTPCLHHISRLALSLNMGEFMTILQLHLRVEKGFRSLQISCLLESQRICSRGRPLPYMCFEGFLLVILLAGVVIFTYYWPWGWLFDVS